MAKTITTDINLINLTIKLDTLVLDSHPNDLKQGAKIAKRIINLDYIKDGGIIKAPIHRWMFGWLKELYGLSKTKGSKVVLPDNMDAYALGTAKDILAGKTEKEWEKTGDKSVVYDLSLIHI